MEVRAALEVLVERGSPNVLSLVGELDLAGVALVAERLAELDGNIEVDCARLDFIDAAGLRVLLAAHGVCAARGNRLVVVNPTRRVRRVLDLTNLGAVLLYGRCNGSAP
jgi:anti-sigma B factor antagonist